MSEGSQGKNLQQTYAHRPSFQPSLVGYFSNLATFSPALRFYLRGFMRTSTLARSAFPFVCLLAVSSLSAQDPGKMLDQYVKATGGNGRLSKLQTLSLEGSLTRVSDGKTGTFTLDTKTPNRYYMELMAGDQPEIVAYNGKSAWHLSMLGEPATLLGQDALELEAASFLATTHLINLKKSKAGAAFVSAAKVGSRDALEIEITMPTGVKRQFFFDSTSHVLLRESGATGGVPQEMIYDDYRPENGIPIAHKLELRRGNETYNIVVNRVSVNQSIGERVFDFPIKSQ